MPKLLPIAALVLLACGDDASSGNAAPAAGDAEAPPPEADTYVAGLEKAGEEGRLMVRLLDSRPAPPQRDENRWLLEVTDGAGEPLTGCALVLDPDMPAHGHGTYEEAVVTEQETPGQYVADPVLLFMPGLWVVPIEVTCGDLSDHVSFSFQIEG